MHLRYLFLCGLFGCTVDLQMPQGILVSCTSDDECPEGLACVVDVGTCMTLEGGCIEKVGDAYRATRPGNPCTQESGESGICLGGVCSASQCGDGFLDTEVLLEECDHGESNSDTAPNGCRTNCREAHCGDDVLDGARGEQCDDGAENGDGKPCSSKCTSYCGDGETQPGEECDDGNNASGDGCDINCTNTGCGNDVITVPEQCDDGALDDDDGCDSNCTFTACGNGVTTLGEVCDDGNREAGDDCSIDCQSEETCGNAYVDLARGETCDLGDDNADVANATCRTNCTFARCGDDLIDDVRGELCDGSALGTASCMDFGFYSGTLSCTNCGYDTSSCEGRCDDGVKQNDEICDGAAPAGESCLDYGFDHGVLGCTQWCTPGFDGCEFMGFRSMNNPPLSELYAVATHGEHVFVTGNIAGLVHYDGETWKRLTIGFDVCSFPLGTDIAVLAPNDVYISTWQGCVLHYDGEQLTRAFLGPTSVDFRGIYAASSTDIVAVGTGGAIYRFDGDDWDAESSTTSANLEDVHGIAGGTRIAVGDNVVLVNNGGGWSALANPSVAGNYMHVWMPNTTNLFMTSNNGYVHHYSAGWTSTLLDPGLGSLNGISGSSMSDIFVVGTSGKAFHKDEHWHAISSGTSRNLHAVTATGGEAVAVGVMGTIRRYTGQTWVDLAIPTETDVVGIFGTSATNVVAVTQSGGGEVAWTFNGSWTNTSGALGVGHLNGVHASAANNMWAVGAAVSNNSIAVRHNGTSWSQVAVTTPGNGATLQDVWVADSDTAFFVGDSRYNGPDSFTLPIFRHEAGAWVEHSSVHARNYGLYAVWGFGPSDVFAVGYLGIFARWNGSTWNISEPFTSSFLWDVWGVANNDVWAVGVSGHIWHFDGASWTKVPSPTDQMLHAVRGFSSDDVFAVGAAGTMLHWDGAAWSVVRTPTTEDLQSLWLDPGRAVYVTGKAGTTLKLLYGKKF